MTRLTRRPNAMPPASPSPLDRPAQYLKRVGPQRAEALHRLGVRTAGDLLYHLPHRYEDASTIRSINSVRVGEDVTVIGEVVSKGVLPTRSGLRIFQAVLRDESGLIECAWPGQPFLDRTIRKGDVVLATGVIRFFHGRQLQPREQVVLVQASARGADGEPADGGHPVAPTAAVATGPDALPEGKVLPIYPATEGLSHRVIRSIFQSNLDALLPHVDAEEVFGPEQLAAAGVPPLREALALLHRPPDPAAAERGRQRLAYEEIFFLQLLHARTHYRETQARKGIAFRRTDQLVGALYRALPFELTGAQTTALREIFEDMTSTRRMNRLLQGDVGSGKTVVALLAALLAAETGYQCALMAPTELLAEQHARTADELLERLPVQSVLLTGRLSSADRRRALEAIAAGDAAIAIGTHALIQDGVAFHRLGLAIIDEQHRFGVRQRLALADLGKATDMLVMSATPIPRSLALSMYGDLDLSVLDERPPGRRRVRTAVRPVQARAAVYKFIRGQVREGRQAYIVYPLVQESEKLDIGAAVEEFERLRTEVFHDLRVALLHGQMPADEKDRTMRRFANHELDVLVATSIVEVGIDVPNASVMVVENAERFGLSQLHQLRGRVGRGTAESYCILVASGGAEAANRLRILASTDDGFEIARADLRLRGMGDFFGARQHGVPELRFFDPEKDEQLLLRARADARERVDRDPELRTTANRALRNRLIARYGDRERLYDVG